MKLDGFICLEKQEQGGEACDGGRTALKQTLLGTFSIISP